MALSHARVTVSTSAVALNTATAAGQRLTIVNTTANAADLGSSTVAAGAGLSLAANATLSVQLGPGEVLFAIRSGGVDTVLSVLRTGA